VKNQTPTINIFEKAARKAGKALIHDFGEIENLQIQTKNIGDFVTNADLKVEKILYETLKYYYPQYSFLMEEKGLIKGNDEETIVIDPIDGTTNFIHGIPMFAIVIAKIVKNEITDGVIFNPSSNEFFWSSKGSGSWCNNKRIRVSKREDLSECIISTSIPHSNNKNSENLSQISKIKNICSGIRCMGSAALDLAYVASGKLDGCWEKDLNIWDMAAGVLIVKEAGGKVTKILDDQWSCDSKEILASNSIIHQELQKKL